jgi:hypothetical protein
MKTNFKPKNSIESNSNNQNIPEEKTLNQNEFENFVSKSGAKGSFMIFRSKNKKDELGIDQL